MHRAFFDTRFLAELYYSKDVNTKQKLAREKRCPEKFLSAVTVHEIYKLALTLEGRETAILIDSMKKYAGMEQNQQRSSHKNVRQPE